MNDPALLLPWFFAGIGLGIVIGQLMAWFNRLMENS